MAKRRDWTNKLVKGPLMRVTAREGSEPFFGKVMKTSQDGLWFQCIDRLGKLRRRYASHKTSKLISITGYDDKLGLLRHHAEQGPGQLARVLHQLSRKEALRIATQHVEARAVADETTSVCEESVFQMANHGAKGTACFFAELFGQLVQRQDDVGEACRTPDSKIPLTHLLAPDIEEAFACFDAHPTPAMADLILEQHWEAICNPDHPLFGFGIFQHIANPRNPYTKKLNDAPETIGEILGTYLRVLPGALLHELAYGGASEVRERILLVTRDLPAETVKAMRKTYDDWAKGADDPHDPKEEKTPLFGSLRLV